MYQEAQEAVANKDENEGEFSSMVQRFVGFQVCVVEVESVVAAAAHALEPGGLLAA